MNDLIVSPVIKKDKIKKIIINILKDYKNISCYLFGSYAKNCATEFSDIDILLFFDKTSYEYSQIKLIQKEISDIFKDNKKYCEPIYGYINDIQTNSHILYRQYINYGVLLYGDDIKNQIKQETKEELKILEYNNYWKALYLKKIEYLNSMIENNIKEHSINWQYLYLISYWYSKAQLTLIDKQHSLNNFTLIYIYQKLMNIKLSTKEENILKYLQKQREGFKSFEELEEDKNISFIDSFNIIKNMIGFKIDVK